MKNSAVPSQLPCEMAHHQLNGVYEDVIRLRLSLLFLKDRASNWLQNREPHSFTTWDALSKAFISKFFFPGKTAKLSADITSFTKEMESLYRKPRRYLKPFSSNALTMVFLTNS